MTKVIFNLYGWLVDNARRSERFASGFVVVMMTLVFIIAFML